MGIMISKWYESLPKNEAVCALVPWEWQSAPPMPFLRKGKLWLYVPFQRVWTEGDELCFSPLLGGMCVYANDGRIGEFRNLCLTEGADPQAVLERVKISESTIYRSNNALNNYLKKLNGLSFSIEHIGAFIPEEMERCRVLLHQALLPGQWMLYEGMMA